MRWRVAAAVAAVAAAVGLNAPGAGADGAVLRIDGRGHGHGVGMSQWGARDLADAGATVEQILGTFYPGTAFAHAGGPVRVAVHQAAGGAAEVRLPAGGEIRSPVEGPQQPGFPVAVAPGEPATVAFDGAYRVGDAVSPSPLWVVPAGDSVVEVPARGRAYRGVLEVVGDGAGLRLVNELDVETYLRGVAEVPATWPAAAQEAQAIAARTWVLRALTTSGEVCDTARCQVYVGATAEAPGRTAAVEATRGLVLVHGGALASTVYSADAGGTTATPEEGFGTSGASYPYLQPVHYDGSNPRPWQVDVPLAEVGRRVGYAGDVRDVRVTSTGPSGRALEVTVDGSAGPVAVSGRDFASALGLRSTLFTTTVLGAEPPPPPAAPPPPPPATAPPTVPVAAAAAAPAIQAIDPDQAGPSARLSPALVAIGLAGLTWLGLLRAVAPAGTRAGRARPVRRSGPRPARWRAGGATRPPSRRRRAAGR